LTAEDALEGDLFGVGVAIDGDSAIVGAWGDDVNFDRDGSAYVFTRSGETWTQEQKLTASDGAASDFFGRTVEISGDTVFISSYLDDDNGENSGSIYVFTRSGTTWTEQQKLTTSDGEAFDFFGLAIDVDGDTAVFGASGRDSNAVGKAYVYKRNGSNWTEFRKLVVSDGVTGDNFGGSVAVSGTNVIAGAYRRDIPLPGLVFDKSSNLAGADQGVGFFFNLLAPTAASATISGKVLSPSGRGVSSAFVHITDQDGNIRTTRTNNFGYFTFEDIEVGQTLIFNVYNKRFQFNTQVINFDESITNLRIIAQL
jgi:hypothetical protein